MSITDEVENQRKYIRYEPITFSVAELVGMYAADPKEIQIKPDFQRLFRWSREQQSNFIESLLLEIPIPPLFFYEVADGTWELLDGLQRVSTLVRFMFARQVIPPQCQGAAGNENDWHYEYQNDLTVPLQLLPGEYLKGQLGMTFKSFPTQLQLNLKRSRLQVYVLKRETNNIYKYEVFKRINSGGTILEDQELRNCSVRLLDSEFPEYLQQLAVNEELVECLGIRDDVARSGYNEELVLRFFAMKNRLSVFRHDVSAFLTSYMEDVARKTVDFDLDAERVQFENTFRVINDALTDGEAFKGKTTDNRSLGPFSPSLFEAISIGIANNLEYAMRLESEVLRDKIIDVITTLKREHLTGAGSNSKAKTIGRIEKAIAMLRKPNDPLREA